MDDNCGRGRAGWAVFLVTAMMMGLCMLATLAFFVGVAIEDKLMCFP